MLSSISSQQVASVMNDPQTTIEDYLLRLSKNCSKTLLPYLSVQANHHLCTLLWTRESREDVLVSSGSLARMERLSRHKQLEAYKFEKSCENDMRHLIQYLASLPGGEKINKLSVNVFAIASGSLTPMEVEINDFSVTPLRSWPHSLAESILKDLSEYQLNAS
jgi:O-succinylbenzoate synthase